jgi:hypothetical protein
MVNSSFNLFIYSMPCRFSKTLNFQYVKTSSEKIALGTILLHGYASYFYAN